MNLLHISFFLGASLYLLGVLISLFYKSEIKISLAEITVSGILFTALFGTGSMIVYWLGGYSDMDRVIWVLPVFLAIFKSYDYVFRPMLFVFFQKGQQIHQYDEVLADCGVKAKVILVDNLKNAYSLGLIPKAATIILGRGLVEEMSPNQVKGVLLHEIAHLKQKHLYVLLLIDLVFFYIILSATYFAIIYFPDQVWVRILIVPVIAPSLPLLTMSMRYFEKKADRFAASIVGRDEYVGALQRLNELSGKRMERFDFSHPTLKARIANIEKCDV